MAQLPNFYESINEANMRLQHTVVLYDDKPYYILCITNHKPDGIFRVYLDAMGNPEGLAMQRVSIPYEWFDEPGGPSRGEKMDQWLDENKDSGVIRKHINSPLFNKFRPFPLGMCNSNGFVIYIERSPVRNTQQGLTRNMLMYYDITNGSDKAVPRGNIPDLTGFHMFSTIMGYYPNPDECLKNLSDPAIVNTGMAFSRNFAFIRGPVDLLFLAYKSDIVGYIPNGDFSSITIAPKFKHTKEVVDDLNLFQDILVKEI